MIYLFYRVKKEDIFMIKFLLESYEDIFTLSTVDVSTSKIQLTVAPDFYNDAEEILADMEKQFMMVRLDEPREVSQGNY